MAETSTERVRRVRARRRAQGRCPECGAFRESAERDKQRPAGEPPTGWKWQLVRTTRRDEHTVEVAREDYIA